MNFVYMSKDRDFAEQGPGLSGWLRCIGLECTFACVFPDTVFFCSFDKVFAEIGMSNVD